LDVLGGRESGGGRLSDSGGAEQRQTIGRQFHPLPLKHEQNPVRYAGGGGGGCKRDRLRGKERTEMD